MQIEITEVYLEEDHFNPVTDCRIPGAWVAIVNGTKQCFAYPREFDSVEAATVYAKERFH